jgi:hypothetical protein
MQSEREMYQARISDIALTIQALSLELNQRLQIEGEYLASEENISRDDLTTQSTIPSVIEAQPTVQTEGIDLEQTEEEVEVEVDIETAEGGEAAHFKVGDKVEITNRHHNLQGQRAENSKSHRLPSKDKSPWYQFNH